MRAAFRPVARRIELLRRPLARLWRLRWLWLMVSLCAVSAANSGAGATAASEASLKMAFVYNFAKFAEWPPTSLDATQKQVTLCVIGEADAFGPGLAAIDGRPLGARELKVRRIARPSELAGCQILFIARSEERRLAELLGAAHAQSVLTISDIADFADADGIIGFVNVDNKVQFEINLRSAKAANLRISSEVLKLAKNVIGK